MARAILGERELVLDPFTFQIEGSVPDCFGENYLGGKPHYADELVTCSEGWMVWTYLPSGDPAWVADCPTFAEAHALAESLSAPTLWDAEALCARCGTRLADDPGLWPEWCQSCWEAHCSRTWWGTCGGVFEPTKGWSNV